MVINQNMEDVYKAEAECLRSVLAEKNELLNQCVKLLFEYGYKFEEEDQKLAKDLIVKIGVRQ